MKVRIDYEIIRINPGFRLAQQESQFIRSNHFTVFFINRKFALLIYGKHYDEIQFQRHRSQVAKTLGRKSHVLSRKQ